MTWHILILSNLSLLQPSENVLVVSFVSAATDPRNAEGRFMACTGGWDWAPTTDTKTPAGAATFSKVGFIQV